LAKIPRTASL